jgi:hypothetical protein
MASTDAARPRSRLYTIGTTNSVALTNLSSATSYTFEVLARDGAGLESDVNSTQFSTPAAPDTTPPNAPPGLYVDQLSYAGARASWSAASDNVGVVGYEYRRTGQQGWTSVGGALSVYLGALTAQTLYTVEVRALDGAGNAGSAASTSFTTPAAPPAKPSGLSYSQYYSSWKASWSAVSGATYYLLRDTLANEQRINAPGTTGYITPASPSNMNSQKPKSVRACNANGCSSDADF